MERKVKKNCGAVPEIRMTPQWMVVLIKEPWLFVFDAEFAVNGSKDTLHLAEGEHPAEKGIAGGVAVT